VSRHRLAGGLALAGVAAAALVGVAVLALPRGALRYTDVPVVQLPLPAAAQAAARPSPEPGAADVPVAAPPVGALAMLASPEPGSEAGPPVPDDPALLEPTPQGTVPRVAADGRTPLRHFARKVARGCDRPCVAVVVTGLGLAREVSARALALPGEVGLAFSPYADTVGEWQARARRGGHEALLELPLQPARYPQDDSGPLTVSAATPAGRQQESVLAVLAAGRGYVALVAGAGAFAAEPAAFAPVARALAARGLGFVELGGSALREAAQGEALAYASALGPVENGSSPAAVEQALAAGEAEAGSTGRALVHVQPTPASLDRLAGWIWSLPAKGLQLVPPGVLIGDRVVDDGRTTASR
jgi:uncharacterized protein